MPSKIDPAVKSRALRMVADHRGDYPSDTGCAGLVWPPSRPYMQAHTVSRAARRAVSPTLRTSAPARACSPNEVTGLVLSQTHTHATAVHTRCAHELIRRVRAVRRIVTLQAWL
jgi:hypothetical protein